MHTLKAIFEIVDLPRYLFLKQYFLQCKCTGTWFERKFSFPKYSNAWIQMFWHTQKLGYCLKIPNRLCMHKRALFTIPPAPIHLTIVSNELKWECTQCRCVVVVEGCLCVSCFVFKVMQLVYSPFTPPAYYPSTAAARRQAQVFMASIKSVCILCHPTAWDLQHIWQTHWIKKGVFNLYRSLEPVCCANSHWVSLLVHVCAHVSRCLCTPPALWECVDLSACVCLYACVYFCVSNECVHTEPACSETPATDNRWSPCIRSVLFPCGSQICQK